MEETVIYLSPSTQDWNIGVGDYGSEEFRMNQIADILQPLLEQRGYTVVRNDPSGTVRDSVAASNQVRPNLHLALHSNASKDGSARGPEIYTNRAGTVADAIAQDIYDEIEKIYPNPELGRGVLYTRSLYEVINTIAPAVLIEIAFHDNPEDAKWIINNEQKIAEAIVRGIDTYFKGNT